MSAGIGQVVMLWPRPESGTVVPAIPVTRQVNVGQSDQRLEVQSEAAASPRLDRPFGRHELPFEPLPTIPEDDRKPLNANALLCAAVALDVVTTRTMAIEESPEILGELVESLMYLGGLGGLDEAAMERLLAYAQGRLGENRAALNRHAAGYMAAFPRPPDDTAEPTAMGGGPVASTPRAITKALKRLEAAAEVAVSEARLRLQARQAVEYRQA